MNRLLFAAAVISLFVSTGCKQEEVELLNTTVVLSPAYSVPALTGRKEKGTATLVLTSENKLTFTLTIDSLDSTDQLQIAHFHVGSPVENGDVLFDLVDGSKIAFNGTTASGELTLTDAQANAVLNDELYINVHSKNVPAGLLRGPVGKQLVYAQDVPLVSLVEGRSETGLATLRLTADGTLYSLVKVNNLLSDDNLLNAHVHYGPLASGGAVMLDLCTSSAAFGASQKIALSSTQSADLQTKECYINCHSSKEPAGFLGAQVR